MQIFCNSPAGNGYTLDMAREVPTYILLLVIAALVGANVFVCRAIFIPHELEVTVFELKEGRVALVRTPDDLTFLIDAGKDAGILRALGGAFPPWRKSIDVVVLTSPAASAAGGAADVLSRYRVSQLVRFGAEGSKSLEAALAAVLGEKGEVNRARAPYGARVKVDGMSVEIISPGTFSISSNSASLLVSSNTPEGIYALGGKEARKIR